MRAAQRRAVTMAATDLGVTLRGVLEMLAVILIIMSLVVISLGTYRVLVARAQIAEVFMVTAGMRTTIFTEHALTGRLSADSFERDGAPFGGAGQYTKIAGFEAGGGIDVELLKQNINSDIAGRVVTLRPFFYGMSGGALVLWNCGSHLPPTGYVTQARDNTTVPTEYLPNHCRDRQHVRISLHSPSGLCQSTAVAFAGGPRTRAGVGQIVRGDASALRR